MKNKLLYLATALALLASPEVFFAQAPALGAAANFVIFTTNGAVGNTGTSHLTGDVGTNSGAFTGFGNVDGVMQSANGKTATAAADLLTAYNQMAATVATFFPAVLLGNNQTLVPGVYSIAGNATLNLNLNLDGQNAANPVFIIRIQGTFSAAALSSVKLLNGAQACNVFWQIEGAVSLAAGTSMVGTIIANNAAINILAGSKLEGRALSTTGAINITSTLGFIPIGCGSPVLTGPLVPNVGSTACYALLTSNGAMTNTGASLIKGDVGTNNGPVSGFTAGMVIGTLHSVPDGSTAAASADLNKLYLALNAMPYDIELLYPAQFGNSLVLTPHVYIMKGAASLTDTVFLNAEGNPNAVFVIQINGALITSTYSNVVLQNGAKSSNVFWKVEGLVDIHDYSIFRGTLVANNGAINLFIGDTLDGRALSTTGAVTTHTVHMTINSASSSITPSGPLAFCSGGSVTLTASSGTSYTWSTGATTQSIVVNTSGTYTVTVGSSCGGGAPSSVTVTVSPSPAAFTGNNTFICTGNSITLGGPPVGTNTYSWTSNPAGFTSTVSNPTVSPTVNTTYTLTETAGASCSKTNSVTIGVNPPPNANAGSNATICGGTPTMIGAPPVVGNTYSWTSLPVGFTSSVSNPTVSPTITTTYTLTESVGASCSKSNSVVITVKPAPVANAGLDKAICYGDSVQIGSASVVGNTYAWISNPAGFVSSISNPVVKPAVTTSYIVKVVMTSTGCASNDTVIVSVGKPLALTGGPRSICPGSSTVIGAAPVSGNTYTWTPSNGLSSTTVSNPTAGPVSTTTYTLTETTAGGCFKKDTVTVTVNNGPAPLAYTGPQRNIADGSCTTIGGPPVAGNSYVWTPADGLSSIAVSQPTACPRVTTTYTLTETNAAGCVIAQNTVEVVVTEEFYNGFSPNGDGKNDGWNIPMLWQYPSNQVLIINRWGAEVWIGINYDSKTVIWNGQNMSGQDLPDGTYYYIISYNNQEKRGWVVLKR
jgi:gliding motility-associated-like protein